VKRNLIDDIRKNRVTYFMMLPGLAFFVLFCYVPMAGAYMAFVDYNSMDGIFGSPFIGFKNFENFVSSGDTLLNAIFNTLLLNSMFIVCGLAAQVGMALLINEIDGRMFKKFTQSLMFLPYFLSWVVIGSLLYGLLTSNGIINGILKYLGVAPIRFYSDPTYWKSIMVMVNVWKFTGYGSVIYLAAISGMDPAIYEAARIDGASRFDQVRLITLPLLKPTVVILTMMALGRMFYGDFGMVVGIVRDNGLIMPAVEVIDSYVYHAMMATRDYGFSTAVGLSQSVLGLVLILFANRVAKKLNDGEGLF